MNLGFGNKKTLDHVGPQKDDHPAILSQNRFKNAYIFGSKNPSAGNHIGVVIDGINSQHEYTLIPHQQRDF